MQIEYHFVGEKTVSEVKSNLALDPSADRKTEPKYQLLL